MRLFAKTYTVVLYRRHGACVTLSRAISVSGPFAIVITFAVTYQSLRSGETKLEKVGVFRLDDEWIWPGEEGIVRYWSTLVSALFVLVNSPRWYTVLVIYKIQTDFSKSTLGRGGDY